ncbi:hypothetical protein RHMOL_Rhmol08G0110500 [Rhododendron molle]|uniref:Uncharacterized protein n=1 Tax=Rhododendron molle TaxID=49168 RepID=A0ACC0MLZ6_RHOML|nr:hypothetical protein RHMOL_Rhmol08G0110500 [Rhododendron molle]
MGKKSSTLMNFLFPLVVVMSFCSHMSVAERRNNNPQKKTYIIHMEKSQIPASFNEHAEWYHSSLKSVSDSAEMHYKYNNVVHGFSTRLTPDEAESIKEQPGVLSVLEETRYQLQTTRTPQFLGLYESVELFPGLHSVSELVIGMLDTGVWPESKSFHDSGMGPVPKSWKGECESGTNFNSSNCNRKLIGARYYLKGYEAANGPINTSIESKSPRDDDGHGTHTSSTAGGSSVKRSSLYGYASGTARGMASRARLAMYKVCWLGGCFGSDILAAMDQAIDDQVNVLSLSLGGEATDYFSDTIAIGAFAAMEKGIFVSCAGGNAGPGPSTVFNVAPWITTVAAGTLDRDFPAYIKLGNGKEFLGVSLYKGASLPKKLLPFIYAANASNSVNGNLCFPGTLIPEKVKGKIVLCDRGVSPRAEKGLVVKEAGGAGMVLANLAANGEELIADAHLLPATAVGEISGDKIKSYLSSNPNPTATIRFEGTKVGIEPSPVVAAFSSRGPNPITPEVLKPDVLAPGVNILAAWSGAASPTGLPEDNRRVEFNIISGTSMACPHVSCLSALLQGAHPDWSPAAIRSALMTTAYAVYNDSQPLLDSDTGKPSTSFAYGSGQVDPVKALNPGLIYDLGVDDYLGFLCALNYTPQQIQILARKSFECDPKMDYSLTNFNYPSFAVPLQSASNMSVVQYARKLTNVGPAATYNVSITLSGSTSVGVLVEPDTLSFSKLNEVKSYTVAFTAPAMPSNSFSYGSIAWSDGKHVVRSPIAISWS